MGIGEQFEFERTGNIDTLNSNSKKIERFNKIKSLPINMTVSCVEFCVDIFNDYDENEINSFSNAIKKAWLVGKDIDQLLNKNS